VSDLGIVEFITARLADTEAEAAYVHSLLRCNYYDLEASGICTCGWPARVLREVAAKRAILERIFTYEAKIDGEWGCCHSAEDIRTGRCPDTKPDEIEGVRLLAGIWSDHESFRAEWSVTE